MTLADKGQVARREMESQRTSRLVGEVVYIYAFDIAYELMRLPVGELLGQPLAQFVVDTSKRAPKQLVYYRPQMVRLPPLERLGPRGRVRLERSVKLLPVGAISIQVRVPFDVERVDELVPFHDLRFSDGGYLYDEVRRLADEVRRELAPYCIRPVSQLGEEEAYTVFCLNNQLSALGLNADRGAEDWVELHRREIASLLTEEMDPEQLSSQEAEESTGRIVSYYKHDVAVMDWDAALLIDDPKNFDESLYIMELANLQLAELEAYDQILDDAVERAYRDLSVRGFRGLKTTIIQRELREIRVDFARITDELSNISKFFGDWHLARLYQGLSARFHLGDWHTSIDGKLKTLDDLYQLLRQDQTNRWMLLMEGTVVVLILFEIIKSFTG
ncbi:MAG TPA: hypothetical protein VFE58_00835 [Tepidisphaeraceae bacterium]|jgi:hypothetical protein|nr:hypothetical protein [Tepidisphaeraceae bacterium]